jgi:2-oxo-3-hexenedioate decarboxylase/2-keto-4-pentenoate hydratase
LRNTTNNVMSNVSQAAQFLLSARFNQDTVENIPKSLYPSSESAAYRIQDEIVGQLARLNGSRTCGYKLACTNKPIMKLLGVDGPFSGRLMSHSTFDSGKVLEASDFVRRVVELEFVLAVDSDLPDSAQPWTAETVRPYIGRFMPGIEIVDYRYADFTLVGGNALIADNAIHGVSILGEADHKHWKNVDLAGHEVTLFVNDEVNATGCGGNVLGSPLIVMAWLANHLQARGKTLVAGDMVTTGTACSVYYAQAGDAITADFGHLGTVSTSFS